MGNSLTNTPKPKALDDRLVLFGMADGAATQGHFDFTGLGISHAAMPLLTGRDVTF